MDGEHLICDQRGLAATIAALNTEQHWELSPNEQQRYFQNLAPLIQFPIPAEKLRRQIAIYHADHSQVAALLDESAPANCQIWTYWMQQAIAILRHKRLDWDLDPMVSTEDLVQVALMGLFKGLASYRYESRLSTWAFTVIAHSVQRYRRDLGARKRSGPTVSLEENPQLQVLAGPDGQPEPDAEYRLLLALIESILADQADQRLPRIFQLWNSEQLLLSAIGQRLCLSQSRVSVLIQQIRLLLQASPAFQSWLTDA